MANNTVCNSHSAVNESQQDYSGVLTSSQWCRINATGHSRDLIVGVSETGPRQ